MKYKIRKNSLNTEEGAELGPTGIQKQIKGHDLLTTTNLKITITESRFQILWRLVIATTSCLNFGLDIGTSQYQDTVNPRIEVKHQLTLYLWPALVGYCLYMRNYLNSSAVVEVVRLSRQESMTWGFVASVQTVFSAYQPDFVFGIN